MGKVYFVNYATAIKCEEFTPSFVLHGKKMLSTTILWGSPFILRVAIKHNITFTTKEELEIIKIILCAFTILNY